MIKLQVIGNLGKDCVVNQVNAKNVINFSVAHTERYKDSQGVQKEKTTWVECAYWTDRTGIAPYLKKGQVVYVEGLPEVRQYQKNDGTAGAALSLRVTSIQLVGGKTEGGAPTANGGYAQPASGSMSAPSTYSSVPAADMQEPVPADDLPF